FDIPAVVVINKHDLNRENERSIERFCGREGVEVAGSIPFSRRVNESIVRGVPVVEYAENGVAARIRGIWRRIAP
ncbi:MAG: (4Fe-4S)-binding protein, partial [Spirochaetota bacterium]